MNTDTSMVGQATKDVLPGDWRLYAINPAKEAAKRLQERARRRLFHYKLYDQKSRPVITVCLVEDVIDGGVAVYSRGVAICSKLDFGVLKNATGFGIARERALKAAQSGQSEFFSQYRGSCPRTLKQLQEVKVLNLFQWKGAGGLRFVASKSLYNTTPTGSERSMIYERNCYDAFRKITFASR